MTGQVRLWALFKSGLRIQEMMNRTALESAFSGFTDMGKGVKVKLDLTEEEVAEI